MGNALARLFTVHAAQSTEKQLALADLLGDHSWSLTLSEGTISFGEGRTFPVQVIGTASDNTGSWLWAWANEESGIPQPLLHAVGLVRKIGEEQGIPELTAAEVPLDEHGGHYLAMICSELCGADAYYRCPYDGGAAFVLMSAPALRQSFPRPAVRMTNAFTSLISTFELPDHRAAFLAYAEGKGLKIESSTADCRCRLPDGDSLVAKFDSLDRLIQLEAEMNKG